MAFPRVIPAAIVVAAFAAAIWLGGALYAADDEEKLRNLANQVAALRSNEPKDERLLKLRGALREFLASPAGRKALPQLLALIVRLPTPEGKQPPAPTFPFDADEAAQYQHAFSQWSGLPLLVTNDAKMELVLIPPGAFVMGAPPGEPRGKSSADDETQHPVWLTQPFYLSRYETTVGQFRQFVDEKSYRTDCEQNGGGHAHDDRAVWKHRPGVSWLKPGFAGPYTLYDRHPVVQVSHHDAVQFCAWLNGPSLPVGYCLPTEAQWEWACRAGSGGAYSWDVAGNALERVANRGDQALKKVHPDWPRSIVAANDGHAFVAPVGSFDTNAFGLHDMLGNVWEFCSTRSGPYPKTLDVDPGDLDPKRGFAVRGGGWSNEVHDVRCATRNADPPHFSHSNLGFRVALTLPPRNASQLMERGPLPRRVHVTETCETDIEKRWWMAGALQTENVPPNSSTSPNRRACRATETLDFDRQLGDRKRPLKAVIFNPVPGPPMGHNTRLAFKYWLSGTDSLRVQIYSLSKNYHRYLQLTGLPQNRWESAAVDMTQLRKPDGGGGPLAEDERIDDIQFYIAPDADLVIDDIVLYDAAEAGEPKPFPRQVIFTGWFDTGKQDAEWPGDFEIVPHEKPRTWKAAHSVKPPAGGEPWLRISLRGRRPLGERTAVRFQYRLTQGTSVRLELGDASSGLKFAATVSEIVADRWAEATVVLPTAGNANGPAMVDELRLFANRGELWVDDVLIYEP